MSLWGDSNQKKNDKKEKEPMTQRFFTACMLILAGVVTLWFAVALLAQFWGWLVLGGLIALTAWIAFKVVQARRNRW